MDSPSQIAIVALRLKPPIRASSCIASPELEPDRGLRVGEKSSIGR